MNNSAESPNQDIDYITRPRDWFREDRPRFRFIPAVLVGASAIAVLFLSSPFRTPWDVIRVIHAWPIFFSGMVSGWIFSGWIGRSGLWGWFVAFCTMWLCAYTCGFVLGTVEYPLFGSLFGGAFAVMFLLTSKAAPVWLTCFIALQMSMIRIRRRA